MEPCRSVAILLSEIEMSSIWPLLKTNTNLEKRSYNQYKGKTARFNDVAEMIHRKVEDFRPFSCYISLNPS